MIMMMIIVKALCHETQIAESGVLTTVGEWGEEHPRGSCKGQMDGGSVGREVSAAMCW